jgi:hypothetical protein
LAATARREKSRVFFIVPFLLNKRAKVATIALE